MPISPSLCWGLILHCQNGHGVCHVAHNAAEPQPCSEEVPLPEPGSTRLLLELWRDLRRSCSQVLEDEQPRSLFICMSPSLAQVPSSRLSAVSKPISI